LKDFAMTTPPLATLPPPSPEHRRVASAQFDRAKQVLVSENFDYAIQLLLGCCKLDPANLTYRQTLRQTEKAKYGDNLKGSRLALLSGATGRMKMKAAKRAGEHLKVLEHGEEILAGNPWDTGVLLDMAHAADALGLLDLAIWLLFQIRETRPNDVTVNRFLARLCEKRGNFTEAILLWEMVRQAVPNDVEAQSKAKDLAASNTIARGKYEEAVQPAPSGEHEERVEGEAPAGTGSAPAPAARDRASQEETALRAQIQQNPANWDLYLRLAALYRRAGDIDQARAVLEQGFDPSGRHFELQLALADLAIEPLRRDLAHAKEELKTQPDNEEWLQTRARLTQEINARELDLYRRKTTHYPGENAYRLELGVRLLRAGEAEDAIREFQAVRQDPRLQWRALMYLGFCFKARAYWRLAEGNFEEALKKLPPNDEASRKKILLQLAQGAAEAGDFHKAVERAYELANLDFNYGNIGRLLDVWQARLKEGG
jgi:Flp pilus assembly protein TadD